LERRDRDARFVLRALGRRRAGDDDLLHRQRRDLFLLDRLGDARKRNQERERQTLDETTEHLDLLVARSPQRPRGPSACLEQRVGLQSTCHWPTRIGVWPRCRKAYITRLPLARSNRCSRSRASSKRAVLPGAGTASGDARPMIRCPSSRPTTQTSSPVGSVKSTSAASALGSSD